MRFEDKIAIVAGEASGIGKEVAKRTPANNRAVMLIGNGRETNPASELYGWVASINDVVGKLVCAGCQGDGTSPYNHTPVILANAHCARARGFFWSAWIGGLLPNARDPLANAWTSYDKK
jgi:NAD(P)-dependent dehydrogenase (short-subunit alcohol dehydrogenase family)